MSATYTQLYDSIGDKGMTRGLLRTTLTPAQRIAWDIVEDLRDRRGLRHEWEGIDPEMQDEIFEVWVGFAEKELAAKGGTR